MLLLSGSLVFIKKGMDFYILHYNKNLDNIVFEITNKLYMDLNFFIILHKKIFHFFKLYILKLKNFKLFLNNKIIINYIILKIHLLFIN
jgi:hypothetical protein